MLRFNAILTLFILLSGAVYCQEEPLSREEQNEKYKGFEFYINGGLYMPNNYTANYYNGTPGNENNTDFVFKNVYRNQEITELLKNRYQITDNTVAVREWPTDMAYSSAFMFGLGIKYKFNLDLELCVQAHSVRLETVDKFSIGITTGAASNIHNDYLLYNIIGKERRSLIDIGLMHTFHTSEHIKYFVEGGININNVKVKESTIVIEEVPFSLINNLNGPYIPGTGVSTYDVIQGGTNFGFYAAGGIKLILNQYFSLDPTITMHYARTNLAGYTEFKPHFSFMARLCISDRFITGNKE